MSLDARQPFPAEVRESWPIGWEALAPEPAPGGLINATWLLGPDWVVQRLHPIFAPEVCLDAAVLGLRLMDAGVPVPVPVPAVDGALWKVVDGGVWRVLPRLPGRNAEGAGTLGQVRAAAGALARFHGALADADHTFAFSRLGIHDTPAHLDRLAVAVGLHLGHRLFERVAPLAEAILVAWSGWEQPEPLPRRIGHGDPKLANFLFEGDAVTGVIDLDTMGFTTLDAELGDALRSWCSTRGESAPDPRFSVERFEVAVTGYLTATGGWLTDAEVDVLPRAAERIAIELASRFAADALNESYFGWDPAVAPTRGEHNLIRAENQLALARDARRVRPALEAVVARLRR
ncbi:MAG: hypothetical protein EP329_14580 [Deltaproteobacteria bacterium]|nr:MAG: hypothetical protein EP329_14580 [Deltaproteobacteria bacterium]